MKRLLTIPMVLAICLLGASRPAHAAAVSLTFDFNSLGSGASASAIQTYMQGVLGGYGTVASVSSGATTDRTYNGDGHVVGPTAYAVTSLTLGTSDGSTQHLSSYDTFLRNVSSYTGFSIVFSGLSITGVSFDYEIFPDGTCPSLSNCGTYNSTTGLYANQPDMTFSTNLGQVFHYYSKTPGSAGGSIYTESPCTDGSSLTTGVSCAGATEAAPQLIGTTSLLTSNVAGATTFNFIDWPATIGIDNFTINFNNGGGGGGQSPVPEPATMLLLGTGLATVAARRRKKSPKA